MSNLKASSRHFKFLTVTSIAILSLAACGGGGGGSSSGMSDSGINSGPASRPQAPSVVTPDTAQPPLPMPTNIANGSVVELECGRTYQGTLDLSGKSNVTVRTAGSCGKAVLTPGQQVTGWSRHQGDIYSAPISFNAAQVLVDGKFLSTAHWPSKSQVWAKAQNANSTSLTYPMPNGDLTGALLTFKAYEWSTDARRVTGYAGGVMTLESTGNRAYDGYAPSAGSEFYVEGKLWMLDEPGEWAVSGDRLYVWAPDGQSPEGRLWAAPNQHGIDATNSRDITIDGVQIYASANGIDGMGAVNLRVLNTDIANSSENGIVNTAGHGLTVDRSSISNSRHNAIFVRWGGGAEVISNSSIDATGVIGMPTNSHAAIYLAHSTGSAVTNNSVTNSGYIGIRTFRNAVVSDNTVDGACLVMSDCGGLYTSAPDKQALNARIERNTFRNVGLTQRLAWAIYLDDHANAVTMADNTMSDNRAGIMIINSFNNTVSGNHFTRSGQAHLVMAEMNVGQIVRNNNVFGNTFISRNGEEAYRISSDYGTGSVSQFATYDRNDFTSASATFTNFNGTPLSFDQWRARTSQDGASTMKAP